MSDMVVVSGFLSDPDSDSAPPVCFVLPEILSGDGAVKEIAKLSDTEGNWNLLLGVNADYEIVVRSTEDDRRALGRVTLAVGRQDMSGIEIAIIR